MFQHKALSSEEVILKIETDIRLKLNSLDQIENSLRNCQKCLCVGCFCFLILWLFLGWSALFLLL